MKRTVITGGGGFIGRSLARYVLSQAAPDDEVVLVDNMERHGADDDIQRLLSEPRVRFFKADLSKADSLGGLEGPVHRLYHLAAIVGVGRVEAEPLRVMKANTLATLNVCEWFRVRAEDGSRLLYASTSEVYAGASMAGFPMPVPTPECVPLVISDAGHPRFSYAISKLWGEAYIHYAAQTTAAQQFVTVRYHNVYGPRMGYDHVIPQVIMRILAREKPFNIVGASQTRAFCYVDDAVEATYRVMETTAPEPGAVVHVGNARQEVKINDLYRMLFALLQWTPAEIEYQLAPKGSVERRCPDTTLLERLTGFIPRVDLREGLKCTADWYRQAKR